MCKHLYLIRDFQHRTLMLPSAPPLAIHPLEAMSTAREAAIDLCMAKSASAQYSLDGGSPFRRSCSPVSQLKTLQGSAKKRLGTVKMTTQVFQFNSRKYGLYSITDLHVDQFLILFYWTF